MADQVPNLEDDFDAMFAQAAKEAEEELQGGAKPADKNPEPEDKTAEEVAAKTAADAKAAEDAAAAGAKTDDDPAVKADAEAKATEDAAAKAEADRVAAEVATKARADAEARLAAEKAAEKPPEETAEQKAAREQFEASIKPYEPSAEEKTAMDKFAKDFPDEHAAVEAKFKAIERTFNARVYQTAQAIVQHMNTIVTPVAEGYNADASERHFTALHTAHADYDAVIAKIPDWIKTQPAYLRPAMQAAYEGGTTQDVLALVGDYKKAVGAAPAPAASAAPAAKPKPAGADDLAPVGSKRTVAGGKGAPDPNDYDGAWGEMAG
jgi:hypothetical protein